MRLLRYPNGSVLFGAIPCGDAQMSVHPIGHPEPGKHITYDASRTIDLESESLNGGVLVKTVGISADPYLRALMRDPKDQPAYTIGEAIHGYGLGRVVRSENPAFKTGDHIYGHPFPFEEYFVLKDTAGFKVMDNKFDVPWSAFMSVLSITGQTAYVGWKKYSKAKNGETLFVTSAAGTVGSLVVQLAKLEGLKVIASSGSDDKVAFTKAIGADVAFNYKTQSTKEVLDSAGPIDIYWDNVGGEVLDLALGAAAIEARFIECGMPATYDNSGQPYGMRNLFSIITKQITINGLSVEAQIHKYYDAFFEEVPPLVKNMKVQYLEDVTYGLETFGQAMYDVARGANKGKCIVMLEGQGQ